MTGILSKSAGVLLLPRSCNDEYSLLDLVEGVELDQKEVQYVYSAAQDWEEIEGTSDEELLNIAKNEYWVERTVSYLRVTISGLEKSLEAEVIEYIEEMLSSRVSAEEVLDRLLIAPISDITLLDYSIKTALSKGFSATAALLEEMRDLQPLLKRLTDCWLSLDKSLLSCLPVTKEAIWLTIVEKSIIKKILTAGCSNDYLKAWNLLTFHFTHPQTRFAISNIGKDLSKEIFPGEKYDAKNLPSRVNEYKDVAEDGKELDISNREAFKRVGKQIDNIVQEISHGHDVKAESFLRQLICKQVSYTGGSEFAVKSLCNIAKQCANMFRIDFERFCLEQAIGIQRHDGWTLVQYGDHLKRIGQYDKALEILSRAERLGQSVVAKSSVADVYSQQGDYEKAILAYKTIPEWNNNPVTLTAIADNLRKMGKLGDARVAYVDLLERAKLNPEFADNEIRGKVGIAEIAKDEGRLDDALRTYERITNKRDKSQESIIYRMGLCNVLKLMEEYQKAYSVVDSVIQDNPFFMRARFTRGSILGLIGKEIEGLKDLPESSGARSWGEWVRCYYRGLLLLKLERYKDAKKDLIEELPKAIASGKEKATLRMAAALWYLIEGDHAGAVNTLSKIDNLHDSHSLYLSLVLKLHLAAQKEDSEKVASLKQKIISLQFEDSNLIKAVKAIEKKNFILAIKYETDALLKMAA